MRGLEATVFWHVLAGSGKSKILNKEKHISLIDADISSCQFPFNVPESKSDCFEDESELFIEVDCFNVEPVLCPAPEGLSQQQVINMSFGLSLKIPCTINDTITFNTFQLVRRCILGSILESEKNYLDALKRILEVCEM